MSNIRRKTAEHLGHAWNVIPHVTQHDKADITALEALRKQYSPQAEKAGGKLTMTAIALKIVAGRAAASSRSSTRRSTWRATRSSTRSRSTSASPSIRRRGLLVPVIRDVDRKGIIELAAELAKASEKARGGKLSLDEMQGGGFTITNLGGIGGTSFTPIVNWPEVAILGISRGSYEPVYNGQTFEPRLMLPLSLSYDHRVIDGADGARSCAGSPRRSSNRSCMRCRWVVTLRRDAEHRASRPRPEPAELMSLPLNSSSSAPARADMRRRSMRRISACRSRWSTRRSIPAASACIAAAFRRRRCCTSPTCSTRRSMPRRGASTFGAPKIDLDRLRAFKTKVVNQLTGGLGQLSKQRKITYIQGTAASATRTRSTSRGGTGNRSRRR